MIGGLALVLHYAREAVKFSPIEEGGWGVLINLKGRNAF